MSTRSAIGTWIGNPSERKVNAVYHHSDGYPSGMGKFLYQKTQDKDVSFHVFLENVLAEKVGWSEFLDKDMRLQPMYSKDDPLGVCRVRQQTANRINKMFQRFLGRSENNPFFITDQQILEKLAEKDAYEKELPFGKPRIPDVVTIKVHDDETYASISELVFVENHPAFSIAKYFYYFAPQSFWERGEDFEMRFESTDDFKNSDVEYVYLFDLPNNKLWIYNNPYNKPFPIDKPLIIIDLKEGFNGDWGEVSEGKYQKTIQMA